MSHHLQIMTSIFLNSGCKRISSSVEYKLNSSDCQRFSLLFKLHLETTGSRWYQFGTGRKDELWGVWIQFSITVIPVKTCQTQLNFKKSSKKGRIASCRENGARFFSNTTILHTVCRFPDFYFVDALPQTSVRRVNFHFCCKDAGDFDELSW